MWLCEATKRVLIDSRSTLIFRQSAPAGFSGHMGNCGWNFCYRGLQSQPGARLSHYRDWSDYFRCSKRRLRRMCGHELLDAFCGRCGSPRRRFRGIFLVIQSVWGRHDSGEYRSVQTKVFRNYPGGKEVHIGVRTLQEVLAACEQKIPESTTPYD